MDEVLVVEDVGFGIGEGAEDVVLDAFDFLLVPGDVEDEFGFLLFLVWFFSHHDLGEELFCKPGLCDCEIDDGNSYKHLRQEMRITHFSHHVQLKIGVKINQPISTINLLSSLCIHQLIRQYWLKQRINSLRHILNQQIQPLLNRKLQCRSNPLRIIHSHNLQL